MIAFLQELPDLLKSSSKRLKCLLFSIDVPGQMFKQVLHLSGKPSLLVGFVSRRPLSEMKKWFPDNLILAGCNGMEIDGPDFSWKFPKLPTIRYQLDELFKLLTMEAGPDWTRQNVHLLGAEMTIDLKRENQLKINRLRQLVQNNIAGSLLGATISDNMICVFPQDHWNRQMLIKKIVDLLPVENGLLPTIFYFGADRRDEPAFQETNLHGYSVLLRENIGRKTAARYYLRNNRELQKVLILFGNK